MKFVLLLTTAIATAIAQIVPMNDCTCWKLYDPVKTPDGVKCYSSSVNGYMPCNIPEEPKCLCRKKRVFGVRKNETGAYCIGKKRDWPCENVREWEEYEENCTAVEHCWRRK